jgi:fluoride exporter
VIRSRRSSSRASNREPEPIDPDLPPQRGAAPLGPFSFVNLALVGVGGALGTLARYACTLTWPTPSYGFPTTILLVNLSGAFLIGVTLSVLVRIGRADRPRLFSCVGVLGGWTTMSTSAVSADLLIAHRHALLGLGYLALSLLGGAVATGRGLALAHHVVNDAPA